MGSIDWIRLNQKEGGRHIDVIQHNSVESIKYKCLVFVVESVCFGALYTAAIIRSSASVEISSRFNAI